MRLTCTIERDEANYVATCLEIDLAAEGATAQDAVDALRREVVARMFSPDAVAPPSHPPDAKPHHYHFELFALDRKLDLPADSGRDQLVAAMSGHVLAKGQIVGVFTKPGVRAR